ncbi:MAG: hypothetical protein ACRDJ3_02115 [Solirubrobacteraceae bacterium]
MAKTQGKVDAPDPDLLAAVVLHTLVSNGRDGLTVAQVALACDRSPNHPHEEREIEIALAILLDDGLAMRAQDLYRPTRPAIRAAELSF